ncbi:ChrR family anti-sigma-E factor [Azorhizobium doebereinerae]|uniref:ChrR family anti-sigma-E factor n=1 Tax=Azorhizobium doebereinerae TaxID=281091 RepID=UPI000423899E|nr:ChrR family anti-sigma-E factor [Azorhizobium doebereinerae]
MTHIPHDDTLARYAAGTLEPGLSLVVETQIELAPAVRARLAVFQAAAGTLLAALPPADMADDALARALARLDTPPPPAPAAPPPRQAAALPDGVRLPRALARCTTGRWIWIGPGVHFSPVGIPGARRASVGLIKAAPGRHLPDHGHHGSELTLVLDGSFSDAGGRYGPGDVCETDESVEHAPVADPREGCVCLIAMDAPLRLKGLLGLLLRPFTG